MAEGKLKSRRFTSPRFKPGFFNKDTIYDETYASSPYLKMVIVVFYVSL